MQIPSIAATQGGRFTYEQALMAGLTKADVDTARRRDEIVRLRQSVYISAEDLALVGSGDRHVFDIRTEQLALGSGWYAARRSAAVVWGIPMIGKPPEVPQLLSDIGRGSSAGRSRHQRVGPLPEVDRDHVEAINVVTMARLVADVARTESFRNGVVVADAVLATGVERAELERCLQRMKRWPGVIQARRVVAFADGLTESALESVSRVGAHQLELPPPELQVEVWQGQTFLGRVDKLWRQYNVVGEDDGLTKYGADEDSIRKALAEEKRREGGLVDAGLVVARWTWAEAWRPQGAFDNRLRRAFARGREQRLDPQVRFVPTTVADRLRREGRLPRAG